MCRSIVAVQMHCKCRAFDGTQTAEHFIANLYFWQAAALCSGMLELAYNSEGLALDFYKSYNRTHHAARQYFDGVDSVSTSLLRFCNNTDFHKACLG